MKEQTTWRRQGIRTLAPLFGLLAVLSATVATAQIHFAAAETYEYFGYEPYPMAQGDLNSDGRPDIVVGDTLDLAVRVYLTNAGRRFQAGALVSTGVVPHWIVVADLTDDGKMDLLVGSGARAKLFLLDGDGAGGFGVPRELNLGMTAWAGLAADFDGDGKTDVALSDRGTNMVHLLQRVPGGFVAGPGQVLSGTQSRMVTGDFNGDGKADLVVSYESADGLSYLAGQTSNAFGVPRSFATGETIGDLLAADFTGDSLSDILTSAGKLYAGVAVIGPSSAVPTVSPPYFHLLAATDLNGDHRADLIVYSGLESTSVLLGNGSGGFTSFSTVRAEVSVVLTGDFNGDGTTDAAAIPNGGYGLAILPGDGEGRLKLAPAYPAGSVPAAVDTGDFDNDRRIDLAVVDSIGNSISILLGER